ncbi:MAG: hypothetical protein A3G29_15625 [Burkholderiales bacterium RIFCSPLOWO2_12_FULL_64_99]|nr:MAG: hypothetical protein A3E52_00005 [Burkholderiales bacterium RIFCSPHIGHO2_12_FULL_63_20]OGB66789.1 MAG: hypothetical protein A3G29_15625 [Burkholderiales bacterium RIFCSPLOWO2_12_FULL_64_99]
MLALNPQQTFIYREITILAWGASVQRAKLYNPAIPYEERESDAFRASLLSFIETVLLPKYKTGCSEADHVANIQSLVNFGTKAGGKLLGPDGYKFGVAQKLLNLLLKYLWCLGHLAEPPHCPVDRIVLAKTALRDKLNWTEIKTETEYNEAIEAIRVVAKAATLSLPQWELQFYSRR